MSPNEIKTIMIVEDEEPLRKALAARMVREGYEVMLASNGQECLDKIKTKIPSLIVLDLLMPVKDGMETLYEIQSKNEYKSIPVLVLTNKSDFGTHVKAYKYGVVNYFVKANTSLDDLANRVKELVA